MADLLQRPPETAARPATLSPPGLDELQALYTLTDRLYRARSLPEAFEAGLDAITGTLGCRRASILLFDEDGVMRFKAWRGLSERYRAKLAGHTPWQPGEPDPAPIFVRDIAETSEADWVKEEIGSEGITSLGFIPLTAGGGVIGKFMTYYAEPREFCSHEIDLAVTIARQVGFSVERHRAEELRQRAEEDLRHSEQRFRLIFEKAPVMIWMSDQNGACLHLNRMLREAWEVAERDVTAFDWRSRMHPEDADAIVGEVGAALRERREFSIDGRYRVSDGSYRIFRTFASPHFSAAGTFHGMIGVNVDITDQEQAAAQRELVFAELNHRVKNTLSLVQAIARQTLRGADHHPVAQAFEGRIGNLAVAHNLLTKTNWENTPLKQVLSDALMIRDGASSRFRLDGPDLFLAPKQALAIAMALHELNTNAVKYGALSVEGGKVDIGWETSGRDPAMLSLTWCEAGGPPVTEPASKGFGSFMIERVLAHDLDGEVTLEFRPDGLRCAVRAPLMRSYA